MPGIQGFFLVVVRFTVTLTATKREEIRPARMHAGLWMVGPPNTHIHAEREWKNIEQFAKRCSGFAGTGTVCEHKCAKN